MTTRALTVGFAMVSLCAVASDAQTFRPATFQTGQLPDLQALAVGGGEVLAELTVGADGSVVDVRTLRETASFTERVVGAVRTWHFTPAQVSYDPEVRRPGEPIVRLVESKVLVAGVFRPPTLNTPTLGEPVQEVAASSPTVPFPSSIVSPPYPPTARDADVMLLEVLVDATGVVTGATVRHSSPAFDGAAIDAARQWTFLPARIDGVYTASIVYVIFGFPVPIV